MRFFGVVLFALFAVFWVVFLAGVGRSQDACVKAANGGGRGGIGGGVDDDEFGRRLLSAEAVEACGNQLGLQWWVLFFQLFLIISAIALAAGSTFIARFKQALVLFFAINLPLLMSVAHDACLSAYTLRNGSGAALDGHRATAAGVVPTIILNFVWLICTTEATGEWTVTLGQLGANRAAAAAGGAAGASKDADAAAAPKKAVLGFFSKRAEQSKDVEVGLGQVAPPMNPKNAQQAASPAKSASSSNSAASAGAVTVTYAEPPYVAPASPEQPSAPPAVGHQQI